MGWAYEVTSKSLSGGNVTITITYTCDGYDPVVRSYVVEAGQSDSWLADTTGAEVDRLERLCAWVDTIKVAPKPEPEV